MQALTPAALPFACASARPLRSVGCRPQSLGSHPPARNRRCGYTGAAPGGARSGKRGWCSPFTRRRRRRRRRVRVRVAQHSGQSAASLPSPQNRHSESVAPRSRLQRACCSASPSRRPGCRRRVRYANTLFDPPTADRRQEPPARLFRLETARRAVRAAQACPHWGRASRSVEGLYES